MNRHELSKRLRTRASPPKIAVRMTIRSPSKIEKANARATFVNKVWAAKRTPATRDATKMSTLVKV